MSDNEQHASPHVLPIGEPPVRRLGLGSMQLTGPGHWAAPDNPSPGHTGPP
jgi:hypothetical protein